MHLRTQYFDWDLWNIFISCGWFRQIKYLNVELEFSPKIE